VFWAKHCKHNIQIFEHWLSKPTKMEQRAEKTTTGCRRLNNMVNII